MCYAGSPLAKGTPLKESRPKVLDDDLTALKAQWDLGFGTIRGRIHCRQCDEEFPSTQLASHRCAPRFGPPTTCLPTPPDDWGLRSSSFPTSTRPDWDPCTDPSVPPTPHHRRGSWIPQPIPSVSPRSAQPRNKASGAKTRTSAPPGTGGWWDDPWGNAEFFARCEAKWGAWRKTDTASDDVLTDSDEEPPLRSTPHTPRQKPRGNHHRQQQQGQQQRPSPQAQEKKWKRVVSKDQQQRNVEALWRQHEVQFERFLQQTPSSVAYSAVPWPETAQEPDLMKEYLEASRPSDPTRHQQLVRQLTMRWHPDKFLQQFGPRLAPSDRERILAKVTHVFQVIGSAK
uniref:NF-kappa-B inhibitor-like protein 1 n=1 Tax=Eutreptiella gymnastica TaxID=73025 RepID=A0A7S1N1Y1_9EUGL|mmetsp:Transcript_105293/g.181601  ORF Transcript_105293/g.181601 Transcript_105293/m.181601 type:complete len:342 (+) Transcript_105293:35-1060(+)